MPADVAPLVADGGNIRLVRRVAAYAYGSRDVTWPEGAEDPKEELPDGREFGWVAQLAGPQPGLSGRRFVRTDAVIDAVEGVSNTEQLLDDAAERTGGDVHFETLISGRGLAGQVPGVDFALGDRVPARFWGRILPGQLVTEVGWEEGGPYAKLGGQMLRDLDALARARAELTRTIRKEREETAGAVEAVRLYADSAVAVERAERAADVDSVRVVLGGAQASEESLVSQLAAVQAQITGMVGDDETPPPAGLLNSYLWMNTRLWKQQETINDQNAKFRDMQVEITARQVQTNLLHNYLIEYNRIVADAYRPIRFFIQTMNGASPEPGAQSFEYGFNVIGNDSDEPLRDLNFTEVVSNQYMMHGRGDMPGVAASGIVRFAFHGGRSGYMRTYLCQIGLHEKGFSVYQSQELRQEIEQRSLSRMDISGDLLPTTLLPFYQAQLDALAAEYRARGLEM